MKQVLTAVASAVRDPASAGGGSRVRAEEPKNKQFSFVLPTKIEGDPALLHRLRQTVMERATLRQLEVNMQPMDPNNNRVLQLEIKGHSDQLRNIRELTESLTSMGLQAKFNFDWKNMAARTETYQAFQISGADIGWQSASQTAQKTALAMGFQVDAIRMGRSDMVRIEGIIPPGRRAEFEGRLRDAFEG